MQMLSYYEMVIKTFLLTILLIIGSANSKPLPNKGIAKQAERFSEKLHNLKVPE